MTIKLPRGTQDILPIDIHKWQHLENLFINVCKNYGFAEIRVPTFEYTELFLKGVGDTSDIVSKEMYTFLDKGDRSITLKPEGTASVMRCILQNGMHNNLPVKLCYTISCFRYDKPQAGRLREFHQFGVESVGSSDSNSDVEVISLASHFLHSLNINNVSLHINSIGCPLCRPKYNEHLLDFLNKNKDSFCNTCNERIHKNPMRVLDCKNDTCKNLVENAPNCVDFLCQDCNTHYENLKKGLTALNIDFIEDTKIVRGLDYYTKTVFEFVSDSLGAQSTVCGGGRYDELLEIIGGKKQPAVGFAMGVERLILIMEKENLQFNDVLYPHLYIANVDDKTKDYAFKLTDMLRRKNFRVETNLLNKSLKAQMRYANNINAKFTIVIGNDEIETNIVNIKNMFTGDIFKTNIENIENYIK